MQRTLGIVAALLVGADKSVQWTGGVQLTRPTTAKAVESDAEKPFVHQAPQLLNLFLRQLTLECNGDMELPWPPNRQVHFASDGVDCDGQELVHVLHLRPRKQTLPLQGGLT